MEELIDVLSDHDFKVRVTRDNIETVIDQIATKEMIQTLHLSRNVYLAYSWAMAWISIFSCNTKEQRQQHEGLSL